VWWLTARPECSSQDTETSSFMLCFSSFSIFTFRCSVTSHFGTLPSVYIIFMEFILTTTTNCLGILLILFYNQLLHFVIDGGPLLFFVMHLFFQNSINRLTVVGRDTGVQDQLWYEQIVSGMNKTLQLH